MAPIHTLADRLSKLSEPLRELIKTMPDHVQAGIFEHADKRPLDMSEEMSVRAVVASIGCRFANFIIAHMGECACCVTVVADVITYAKRPTAPGECRECASPLVGGELGDGLCMGCKDRAP